MIDFWDCTWYCHWDKTLVCKKRFNCDDCKHQPADDDKENGKAEPVHIHWVEDYDGSKIPECPSCGEMPHVLYNCSATRPGVSGSTTNNTKEPSTESLTITASPLSDGRIKARTTPETPDEKYNNWYKTVWQPSAGVGG